MGVRARQLEAGLSARYANNTLELIRTLARFAVKGGHMERLPFVVKFLRIQKKPRATVPAPSLTSFFSAIDQEAHTPHVRVLLRVMVGPGLREGEALGMRWQWFDHSAQTYAVGKAKGKEARVLPVPDWLWSVVHAMPKPMLSEWVFPAEDGKPHRSQYCKKVLKRVCETMGLGNVTQHRLRATFASLHAEAGTPVPEIQGMLGHKSIATTMIYVETSLDAKRRAQNSLSQKLGLA
jgi:integrase